MIDAYGLGYGVKVGESRGVPGSPEKLNGVYGIDHHDSQNGHDGNDNKKLDKGEACFWPIGAYNSGVFCSFPYKCPCDASQD